jgi:hypothetical protein
LINIGEVEGDKLFVQQDKHTTLQQMRMPMVAGTAAISMGACQRLMELNTRILERVTKESLRKGQKFAMKSVSYLFVLSSFRK